MKEEQRLLLLIIGDTLFQGTKPSLTVTEDIVKEAIQQAVLPLLCDYSDSTDIKNAINKILANNIRVEYEHAELQELMMENRIRYTTIKGWASAAYYPNPILRTMGDVDFLIHESDVDRVATMLKQVGFEREAGSTDYHDDYRRFPDSVWEAHTSIKGVPLNNKGDCIRRYLSDTIASSKTIVTDCGNIRVPDQFHHGLILLLHTASHLTAEGVGLRHLCDWAVFYTSFSDNEFRVMFEKTLSECGLWRFAQLLTLVSVKYIGAPQREWAGNADDAVLELMMEDIINGGNFGCKDTDRVNQIKYIVNRGEGTVDNKSPIVQAFYTLNANAKRLYPGLMLPIGWISESARFVSQVVSRKRTHSSFSTIRKAEERKRLYTEFRLFE